jgi:hypothetical protein
MGFGIRPTSYGESNGSHAVNYADFFILLNKFTIIICLMVTLIFYFNLNLKGV